MSDYKNGLWDISQLDTNAKILFLSADFNRNYTKAQEEVTQDFLGKHGFTNIEKILVPGAFEIP